MTEQEQQENRLTRGGMAAAKSEKLPYRVELWDADKRGTVERVLARALNATLARAIFKAAQSEYPSRRITLRHRRRIVSDSSR